MANSITADEIREQFSQAMSAMYQQEVPQYGTLLELVADVNLAVLENNPQLHEKMVNADELARLNVERHGAIRVGTAQELATLRRMFAIMGMYPVSYYDLSQAGEHLRPGGGLLRPFQPCFGDAESAAKNDQLDALSLFGSLRGRGEIMELCSL